MTSFKRYYKIDNTGQMIEVSMHQMEDDYSEFTIRIRSESEIKMSALSMVLLEYSEAIHDECKAEPEKLKV